jgi:hypothetical protein
MPTAETRLQGERSEWSQSRVQICECVEHRQAKMSEEVFEKGSSWPRQTPNDGSNLSNDLGVGAWIRRMRSGQLVWRL